MANRRYEESGEDLGIDGLSPGCCGKGMCWHFEVLGVGWGEKKIESVPPCGLNEVRAGWWHDNRRKHIDGVKWEASAYGCPSGSKHGTI